MSQYNMFDLEEKRENELNAKEDRLLERILFFILFLLLAVTPLITRTKVIDWISPIITDNIYATGTKGDVFTFYKFWFLVIFTCVLVTIFLYRIFALGFRVKASFINISVGILFLTILVSTFTSPFKSIALTGMYNRHEGAVTYLCYLTIFFIAANLHYSKKIARFFIYALYPITVVNAFLGIIYFYGIDLMQYDWVKNIIIPSNIAKNALVEGASLSTTINNPNYVSGISAVLLSVFFSAALFDDNKVRKIINALFSVLAFAMLLSSLSSSGFVTTVVVLPILLLFVFISKKGQLKKLFLYAAVLIAFTTTFILMGSHNNRVWNETFGMFMDTNPFVQKQNQAMNIDKSVIDSFVYMKNVTSEVAFPKKVFAESNITDTNDSFTLPNIPKPGSAAGSGRVYIWEKTFDLIQQRPFFGYGLDTLTYTFPQNDPQKIANLRTHTVIVDKPHNFYLNLAYGCGIIALLALLYLLGVYFITFIKNIKKLDYFFIFLLTGWLAYVIQGLFNDSVIGTAPIFWVLFGVGVSVMGNYQMKET